MSDETGCKTALDGHPDRFLFETLALWRARGRALDAALDDGVDALPRDRKALDEITTASP